MKLTNNQTNNTQRKGETTMNPNKLPSPKQLHKFSQQQDLRRSKETRQQETPDLYYLIYDKYTAAKLSTDRLNSIKFSIKLELQFQTDIMPSIIDITNVATLLYKQSPNYANLLTKVKDPNKDSVRNTAIHSEHLALAVNEVKTRHLPIIIIITNQLYIYDKTSKKAEVKSPKLWLPIYNRAKTAFINNQPVYIYNYNTDRLIQWTSLEDQKGTIIESFNPESYNPQDNYDDINQALREHYQDYDIMVYKERYIKSYHTDENGKEWANYYPRWDIDTQATNQLIQIYSELLDLPDPAKIKEEYETLKELFTNKEAAQEQYYKDPDHTLELFNRYNQLAAKYEQVSYEQLREREYYQQQQLMENN